MASRRDLDEPPGEEIRDFVEYAELYRLAWSDDVIRWVLSTLPSAMIFDDHDIRDDWNTSWSWRREIRTTTWWQERIVSGLASYWVHQHIGNLSPAELADEEVWRRRRRARGLRGAGGARPHRPPRHRRRPRRRGADELPVELHPGARRLRPRRHRLAGRPRAAPRRPVDARRGGDALGGRRAVGRRPAPLHRHLTAVPPAAGSARLRGDGRGHGAGRLRTDGRAHCGTPEAGDRPRALGRLQRGLRRALRAGHGGRARPARAGTRDDHVPLRGRAQLLPRRGDRPGGPRRASRESSRPSARRSATRCPAPCASSCPSSRSHS